MADRPLTASVTRLVRSRRPRDGIEGLYRSHVEWLRRALGYRLGGHAADIDDIVQDAYIRAARYSDDDAHRHPRALLLQIALNLAKDQRRRDARMPANDLATLDDIALEGDQEYLLALKRTILSLPPEFRHVFVLSRFTAMTNVQIAEQLGVSVKTVEYRMRKALLLCAERLAP
ncbi:RNA polymerase sigma factor [Blastomonas fulva]|jgi:RNA polymerase sigma factor (sigma-70 family)|uniref:RNA polymerase sigma factor n=1 Tax=Blastomonas fulva TaxID=1550728 RepID=UPI003D2ACAC7